MPQMGRSQRERVPESYWLERSGAAAPLAARASAEVARATARSLPVTVATPHCLCEDARVARPASAMLPALRVRALRIAALRRRWFEVAFARRAVATARAVERRGQPGRLERARQLRSLGTSGECRSKNPRRSPLRLRGARRCRL